MLVSISKFARNSFPQMHTFNKNKITM
uniref:Uncharacterized protein n=1 Tax=Arundo donax TaxID=35708 RepID=A0A0A8Y4B0_ARUDO